VPINQVKDSEREENKKRDKRKNITPLGPSGGFYWWLGSSIGRWATYQEACPFFFYVLRVPVVTPQVRSTVAGNESVGTRRGGVSVISQSPSAELSFSLAQAFNFLCSISEGERWISQDSIPLACHHSLPA